MSNQPTPLRIPRALLERVYRQARDDYPRESCGWLSGGRDSAFVDSVRPCVNAQAQGGHPTAPSRTAETAYVLAPEDLMALNRSFSTDEPAKIIYHSHPNGRAYFSGIDRDAANPWGDGPAYPVQQLVVGLDATRVVEATLFAWSSEEGDFVEVARFEGANV